MFTSEQIASLERLKHALFQTGNMRIWNSVRTELYRDARAARGMQHVILMTEVTGFLAMQPDFKISDLETIEKIYKDMPTKNSESIINAAHEVLDYNRVN